MRILIMLLSCIALCSCVQKQLAPPNILFIVSEDNGPDLGCYGNENVYTPHLDALAEEGLLFENAYVTYSVCSPSRGTIFTGLYPHQNGQIGLATHKYRMFEGVKTLPKYLGEQGYRTGCIGKVHVNPESEIPWDYRPEGLLATANFGKKRMPDYAKCAVDFVQQAESPYYLQVNFPDAHFPVQKQVEGLPTTIVEKDDIEGVLPFVGANSDYLREVTANYYNCMNRLDEAVGMLLDSMERIGALDNTIIIYMGDHGAQFSRGKCSNYEGALRVPFIVKWDGHVKQGQVSEALISSVELLPTFIDIAGGAVVPTLPAQSLVPLFEDPTMPWSEYVFAGGAGATPAMYFPRRSVRGKRFKLIHNLIPSEENPHFDFYVSRKGHFSGGTIIPEMEACEETFKKAYETWRHPSEYELYDLDADSLELQNLYDDEKYSVDFERMKKALSDWQKQTQDPLANADKLDMLTNEMRSVYINNPKKEYRSNVDFKWEYINYLNK